MWYWHQVWNVLGVLNYLQALIDKSGIVDTLEKVREPRGSGRVECGRDRLSCSASECSSARWTQERQGEVGFSANEGYDFASSNVLRLLASPRPPPPPPWLTWLGERARAPPAILRNTAPSVPPAETRALRQTRHALLNWKPALCCRATSRWLGCCGCTA